MRQKFTLLLTLLLLSTSIFADWKLSQKTKQAGSDVGMITTTYHKGVRTRTEMKMDLDPETQKMMQQMGGMGGMMPEMPITIQQCDLKQDVFLSEMNKQFYIDYYDWSSLPPAKLARRGNQKITVKGTMTIDNWIEDSGKRQKMFGLDARWLKFTTTMETSADACDPSPPIKMEQEGWFVKLSLDAETCPTDRPTAKGGCIPKVIYKRIAYPGVMITGTTKTYQSGKLLGTSQIETIDLSKATLDQALFDVPKDPWVEVESMEALTKKRRNIDTTAKTVFGDGGKAQKTIAIDFFSGSANKIDQEAARNYISSKASAAGLSGYLITSSADLAGGRFANVIGVEIKKIKESGAAKIGGLFGKITGNSDGAKAGTSTANIIVTLYASDGKTVVASSPATAEVKGSSDDAVRAAIDQVIGALLAKAK
ncbi:MAG: hypothetical protein UZ17_ACD001001317 [Acidobacteria bacterium OLB17]|nr:MAG: hypothetical protein UZ17_ACD001001317 [Acidobacteria bacterium OLB17]MCZ2391713.1 hypothetical protein [Acidobacteriota bacterium]